MRRRTDVDSRRVSATILAVGVLLLAACDGGQEAVEPPEDIEEEAAKPEAEPEEDSGPVEEVLDDAADPEVDEEPSFVEVDEQPPRFAYPDVDGIELLTSGAGGGPWPVLAWEPVEGAQSYSVTLYAESGAVYWRWRGETTEVRVGGFAEEPAPDAPLSPRVEGDMLWDVLARDADGSVIAQSGERPIAP